MKTYKAQDFLGYKYLILFIGKSIYTRKYQNKNVQKFKEHFSSRKEAFEAFKYKTISTIYYWKR